MFKRWYSWRLPRRFKLSLREWPTTLLKIMGAQWTDIYCSQLRQYIGLRNTTFTYDKDGTLVGKAPIGVAIRKVLPTTLRTRALYSAHYSLLAGHAGKRSKYYWLTRELYWAHMRRLVYTVVNNCTECPGIGTHFIRYRESEILPPAGSLRFVAKDFLGPFPKTKAGKQFVAIMTGRYAKLKRAVATTMGTSTQVANIFFND